ncbi:MAG: 50S ribosomal protein L11 methyltransferase [Bacteroidia bacterium]
MNYIELSVNVSPRETGSDVLIAELSDLGFESFVESDEGFKAYIREADFDRSLAEETFAHYKNIFTISHSSLVIEQQNWNSEWESSFQPITVDGKCYIHAPFHKPDPNYRYNIMIEPKMSFGTGHHDTTQLMIRQLMLLNVKNKSLLDMGCGTGVLAIVASMQGAEPITAIDVDQWSYENTIENLGKNNINNVLVHKGDAQILAGKRFHVILANINKNVLLADIPAYANAMEKDGTLLLSGFFETDIAELRPAAEKHGLKYEGAKVSNQWALLHFTKQNA